MPFSHRRLVLSAVVILSLAVAAMTLRIALEWHQALSDIDSMIETPAAITIPTDAPVALGAEPPAEPQHIHSTDAVQPAPAAAPANPPASVDEGPTLGEESLNILLLGTDARPSDTEPTRTDAMVLVRISRDNGRVSMLSIP